MLIVHLLEEQLGIPPLVKACLFWGLMAVMVWYLLDTRGVRIATAMRYKQVSMKGSKFNPKDPLTITISKTP
jgi:hypothetical protein